MTIFYHDPAQMEPLLVEGSRPSYGALIGLSHELAEASARLESSLAKTTAQSLALLVTGMNCYYSNLIEGHHTRPLEIEQALKGSDKKNLKSLIQAHIKSDGWTKTQSIKSMTPFLLEIHKRFCQHLPTEMLRLEDGSTMVAGTFRTSEVVVGNHVAPAANKLPDFMDRFEKIYGRRLEKAHSGGIGMLEGILASIIAHHRLVWIHPFADGNGRVARILLDAMLRECGVNQGSLWSLSRGFAKTAQEYKTRLAEADQPRMGDLDGRGNLSEKGLISFCSYALQTAIDQAHFMGKMFALDHFKFRAQNFFGRVRFDLKPESVHLYLHAYSNGAFERMEAGRITGLSERTARTLLNKLIEEGFLVSDTPRGKVRIGFPVHALGSLLPNLYPAGDLDHLNAPAGMA
jgi:Fic family protein